MSKLVYSDDFNKFRNRDTRYAAKEILEVFLKQLKYRPNSMIDIGCGVGTWLKTAQLNYGIDDIIGVDGEYVPEKYLQINKDCFIPSNLEEDFLNFIYKKLGAQKRFDILISLEVAEHIRRNRAEKFVDQLCELSDVILFSAAIPYQGGDGHINERRLSYWLELFSRNNYQIRDSIRIEIWNDRKIPVWYRNNVVIFYNCRTENLLNNVDDSKGILDIVHPDMYERNIWLCKKKIKELNDNMTLKNVVKGNICKIGYKIKKLV